MSESTPPQTSRVTGRVVIGAVGVALGLAAARLFLSSAFRSVTGFVPFDLQFPLGRQAIAIQLGALGKGVAAQAYVPFAIADALLALAAAWAIALLWLWIFHKAPNRLFVFLSRGGIFLVPVTAGVLDIAENVEFYRLIHGLSGPAYADTIEMTTSVHALKSAFVYVRDYLTAAVVLVGLLTLWLQRRQRKTVV
jgi:hypothetical protein